MITRKNTAVSSHPPKQERFVDEFKKTVIRTLPSRFEQLLRDSSQVETILQRIKDHAASEQGIFVKVHAGYQKIKVDDIYLIEALSDYLNIYTRDKRYTIHCTMHHIMDKLPKTDFLRVHRSFIVRLDRITAIEDNNMLCVEDRLVPIGKTYKQDVIVRLNVFY